MLNKVNELTLEALLVAVDGAIRDNPDNAKEFLEALDVELRARREKLNVSD